MSNVVNLNDRREQPLSKRELERLEQMNHASIGLPQNYQIRNGVVCFVGAAQSMAAGSEGSSWPESSWHEIDSLPASGLDASAAATLLASPPNAAKQPSKQRMPFMFFVGLAFMVLGNVLMYSSGFAAGTMVVLLGMALLALATIRALKI